MKRMGASMVVSVSDFKRSPTGVIARAEGEAMLERLDDFALVEVARERTHEEPACVPLDEL